MESLNRVSTSSNNLNILEVESANYIFSPISSNYGSEVENQNEVKDQNEINPSNPCSSSEERKILNHEVSTQVTLTKSRLVSATSLRIITSLTSMTSTSPQEVLTVNTDYGSESSGTCSLLVGVIEQTNQPHLRIETNQNMETVQIATTELSDLPPYRNYIPRQNIRSYRNRHWISNCCNRSDVLELDEIVDRQPHSGEAPPSYTTLYTRPRSNFRDPQLLFLPEDNDSSFEVPTPPPSYAQSQGICMASYSMDPLISISSSSERFLSSQSTAAICPRCATYVLTVVDIHRSIITHITALLLFMCGCWPCCMIPYCVDSCQTAHHYCPICRSFLGTYSPW